MDNRYLNHSGLPTPGVRLAAQLLPLAWRAILLIGVSLALLLVAVTFAHAPATKIQDARFRQVRLVIPKGQSYTIYDGSQLEGQVREVLFNLGLPIHLKAKHTVSLPSKGRTFFTHYRYPSASFEPEMRLDAELVDESGRVLPLRFLTGSARCEGKDTTCYCAWALDSPPKSAISGVLRLKWHTNGATVAEISVRKL